MSCSILSNGPFQQYSFKQPMVTILGNASQPQHLRNFTLIHTHYKDPHSMLKSNTCRHIKSLTLISSHRSYGLQFVTADLEYFPTVHNVLS